MKIIKDKRRYKCRFCRNSIETEHKVRIMNKYAHYHLSCYCEILNNTIRGNEVSNRGYWNNLKKFNILQKEIEEEKRVLKKQRVFEGL